MRRATAPLVGGAAAPTGVDATMAQPPASPRGAQSSEKLLFEYVQRLEKQKTGRRVVHLHLSALRPVNRRDHHIRAAAECFEPIVKSLNGQLFTLKNADIFFGFKSEVLVQVETAVRKARFFFSDDPLVAEEDKSATPFATWYDAASQFEEIHKLVRGLVDAETKRQEDAGSRQDARAGLMAKKTKGEVLTPEVLDRVETALQRADLSNLVRRQYVCTVDGKMVPESMFSELFISIQDLRETILPDVNLVSNRWLFRHLTETLDLRVLSLLAKEDRGSISGHVSFNVNVRTVLAPDFLAFDENIAASRRGSMIIELQLEDIFADLGSFLFARDFVQNKGYRVSLDGLTVQTITMVDRQRLGADLAKLVWAPELGEGAGELHERVRAWVARAGEGKVVLCRCDNREAIDFGRAIGISLFQGRFVENLIAEDARRRQLLKLKHRMERG
jgi:hypothetical protein